MSYKLREQKLEPAGLNLLVPGDAQLGPAGNSTDLTDWWPGAGGRLEQAPTAVLLSNPSVLSTQDSILQADGRIYYGGGGNLRQIGRSSEAPIDTGYDGTPLGMISYQGYVWIMNRSQQRKDDGSATTDWSIPAPAAPTLTDGGQWSTGTSGLRALAYTYYITWVIAGLGESNPSPAATITPALDGSTVGITRPAVPAGLGITGWNIYRGVPASGGTLLDGLAAPYLVNGPAYVAAIVGLASGVVDAGVNLFTDTGDPAIGLDDTGLLRGGVIMESDHDPAPPARVIAQQIYNGRIVVASSAAHPNRIWYTQALQPAFFRGSGNENDGDWVDVGTDKGDAVLAMTVRPGMVVIYRQHSIWRHLGDFGANDAVLEVVVPDLGAAGVRAVCSTGVGDYFVSNDGVHIFNNDWPKKISTAVEPIFRGLTTENFPTLGTAYRSSCAIGYRNGRVWVSYPGGAGTPAGSLIYHVDSGRWFAGSVGYLAFLDTGGAFLGSNGGVFTLESTYTTGNSLLAYQSQYEDCGFPDREKTWGDLVVPRNTQNQSLTVTIRTNKDATSNDSFVLTTLSSTVLDKQIIPLNYPSLYAVGPLRGKPIRSYSLSVRITGNGANAAPPVIIDSPLLLHYYLEARKGNTFDSGITSHGLVGVGVLEQVEIDCDSSGGTATLMISSDIPGGVQADRAGAMSIQQTVGRQVLMMPPFGPPIRGRLFRHQISAPNGIQVYGYKVRVLPIGVYRDGLQGDFWITQPLTPSQS